MVLVNAENISRLMDCAWHDINGHNKIKGQQGETASSAIKLRRLFPDSIIVLMTSADDMEMARYEDAITILYAQPLYFVNRCL